jgi:hypothetical protein
MKMNVESKFNPEDTIYFFTDRWSNAPVLKTEQISEIHFDAKTSGSKRVIYLTARYHRVRELEAFSSAEEAIKDLEARYQDIISALRLRYPSST